MSTCAMPAPPVHGPAGRFHPGGLELTSRAVEAGAFCSGERVLDVGCGYGMAVPWLAQSLGVQAAGIDLRLPALQDGQARFPGVSLACARAERLPFGTETWDALLAECSLSATPDLDRVLAECYRVLVWGGRLVISDLYRRSSATNSEPFMVLDQPGWLTRLETNGFLISLWEDHTSALKVWAAQAILDGQSLASLWGGCAPASAENPAALAQLRLGYFLLVTQKIRA